MLKAQQERQKYWHSLAKIEKWSSSSRFGHEGQIRLEQEHIVVIAYQVLPDIGQQNNVRTRLLIVCSHFVVNALTKVLVLSANVFLGAVCGPIRSGESSISKKDSAQRPPNRMSNT